MNTGIEYRTAQPQDEDALLQLWADILEDTYLNRQLVFGNFTNDPHRFARTQVAIAADGALCGAVAYWLRNIYQDNAKAVPVGHLWGVATRPAYQRQGIATALLQRTVTSMQQEGCQWAFLFTREDARALYARLNWQGVSTIYHGGFVKNDLSMIAPYQVRLYDPWQEVDGWRPLATIYADYNQHRLGSIVRSSAYWQGYIAWMARDWVDNQCARYLVVTRAEQEICGYALVHFYDQVYAASHFNSPPWFSISEIGVLNNATGAMTALLAGVARHAQTQQMVYGHLSVPQELQLEEAIHTVFHQPLNQEEVTGTMMARPLVPALMTAQASTLFTASGALLWEIDRY